MSEEIENKSMKGNTRTARREDKGVRGEEEK